jgi:stage III sporulation protein AE
VLIVALLLALAVPARAVELSDALDLDAVAEAAPPEAAEILGETDVTDSDFAAGLEKLWSAALAAFPSVLREVLRPLAAIVAVTLLCALAEGFAPAAGETAAFAGSLAVAAVGAQDVRSVLTLGSETLGRLSEFSHVLLPTLTTAAAVGGAPGTAGAVWAASALFSDALLTAADRLILPLICGFTAAGCAAAVLGEKRIDGAVQLLQWLARTLLKAMVLAFTGYLAVTKALGAASDAAAVKTAKAALSAVPVVGRTLSDASEALVAGAGLLRAAVGVYGMLAVAAALLLPLLRLALRCLVIRAAAAVCSGVAGERIAGLIGRLGAAYALLLGLVSAAAAIEFLAIISLIRTVTP